MKQYTLNSTGVLSRYDYLWRMSQDRWAWEYLRRNPKFIKDANRCPQSDISELTVCHSIKVYKSRVPQDIAARWGLIMMADPALNAFDANVVWSKTAYPDQVAINVVPRAEGETCEIYDDSVALCRISHFTDANGEEYLLTRGNGCLFQSRCTGLSLLGGKPVKMVLSLPDFQSYDRISKAHKEGMRVFGNDPTAETPKWTKRTQILRDGLVALDCLDLGMSHKDIAVVLYGEDKVACEWDEASMRNAVRYLIKRATSLRNGGYRIELLGGHLGRAYVENTYPKRMPSTVREQKRRIVFSAKGHIRPTSRGKGEAL